ncbi:MAG: DUF362 domain-containing protein [Nitrospirae bacterium]|nr:DUF362 domain-containing protein [Nitrospirota bacterium]
MPTVIIRKAMYDYDTLRPAFFEIMDRLGGKSIARNSRVVIKPNLLSPASPEKAVVTHPLVVRAAVQYVHERNALPVISDSPAMGSFEKVLKESGIKDALKGLDVEYREFKKSVAVTAGGLFHTISIAEDALNADVMINLPKLKTHAQMLLTLGVKNLFGCVVGLSKPEWHLRTGADRDMFARLLVQIFNAVNPSFTVLDGILAMEGQGPGRSGKPREIGVLMGSGNAAALDSVVCRMLGLAPEELLTCRAAREMGLLGGEIAVDGEIPEIKDFEFPVVGSLLFGPKKLHGTMRRHLVQRPEVDEATCALCGECWKYCPAKAIERKGRRIAFDYDKCIRCYCCIEVCPHGALKAVETLPGKVLRKITKR